ncbi:MAG: MFS transporter [Proteobacteria bacterium]|nr:MFS transporter [Pseudomonadota bacterium]NCV00875.1 MFS transporter [Pseudomonadota bacterium]NDF38227.1 MFS transporter [Pseudomonadota bacterium]
MVHECADEGLSQPPGCRGARVEARDERLPESVHATGNELVSRAPSPRGCEKVQDYPGSQSVRGCIRRRTNTIRVRANDRPFGHGTSGYHSRRYFPAGCGVGARTMMLARRGAPEGRPMTAQTSPAPASVPAAGTSDGTSFPVRHLPLLALMTVAHAIVDTYATMVLPLLPFWQVKFGLSYGVAGLIAAISSLTGSVAQPIVGIVTDRGRDPRWVALSTLIAAVGISMIGIAPTYPIFLACVVLGGLGTSGFHPQGYKIVGSYSGTKQALATSWFLVGGNVGVAMGPLLGTFFVVTYGTAGTLGMLPFGIVIAGALWYALPKWTAMPVDEFGVKTEPAPPTPPPAEIALLSRTRRFIALGFLIAVVAVRSTISSSLNSYIPLYFVRDAHESEAFASQVLSIMLLIGAGATLLGGFLADRFGRLQVLAATLAGIPPCLIGFLLLPAASPVAIALLWAAGALVTAGFSITVVLAQELWFERRALASGLIVGFAFGAGGLFVPAVGSVADAMGLKAAIYVLAGLPVIVLALTGIVAWLLAPGTRREQAFGR